jgi:hypothetical protein
VQQAKGKWIQLPIVKKLPPNFFFFLPSGNGNHIGTGKQVQNKKPSIATFPD